MGRVAKLLSFVRLTRNDAKVSDVKIDPGGGPNIIVEHFAAPGDDSFPLKTDYVVTTEIERSGNEAAIGYIDPISEPVALEGEKRIYGRDANGVTKNQIWLKADGSILLSNDNGSLLINPDGSILTSNVNGSILLRADGGSIVTTPQSTFDAKADGSIKGANGSGSFELQAGGDFLVNGVSIDVAGNVTTPANITAAVVSAPSILANGKDVADHLHPAGTPPGNTGTNI